MNGISALITGGTRGIGRAIAENISPQCSCLYLLSRDARMSNTMIGRIHQINPNCIVVPITGDLAQKRSAAAKAAKSVEKYTGKLDLLILNAGCYIDGDLVTLPDADFERNMLINCCSAHYMVSELLRFLQVGQSPRVIFIGSTAAYEVCPSAPGYGMAKWGLRGYVLNLRSELLKYDIGVTFISPGATLTDMWEGEDYPNDHLLRPDDIGKLVAATLTLNPQSVVEELIVRSLPREKQKHWTKYHE
jgi:NAD(P)-dependent dehydrogenase (short-subunit alcohol dehydrogenase family)